MDDLIEETEEEPWPAHPVLGAQELLRFSRVRQLLQDGGRTEDFIDGQAQKGPGARGPNPQRTDCRRLGAGGAGTGLYYRENKIRFPFQAECRRTKAVSPLLKGERVEVRRLAPEDACTADMLVQIHWHGRKMAVPLSQLIGIDVDESTAEAIADWHYWVAQGYCF